MTTLSISLLILGIVSMAYAVVRDKQRSHDYNVFFYFIIGVVFTASGLFVGLVNLVNG